MRRAVYGLALAALLALAGCGTAPQQPASAPAARPAPAAKPAAKPEPGVPVLPPAGSGRGGYYQDDGPGENPPPNLMATPDAEVRNEPLNPRNSKPYVVFGKTYTPITDPNKTFVQRGLGTWYGKKFHGQRTSSGEIYDMYKMSAAHPTLPIPSYAKVTNLDNGNQVVVRINDRGPFHSTRVIDVSYTAALKLGLLGKGSHQLEVERILPADVDRFNAERSQQKAAAAQPEPKPENKPKPRAPSETAAMLYPSPPSGAAVATASVAAVPSGPESAAPALALASQMPQPLQAMPRAAPLILTPQAGAAMPAAVSPAAMTTPAAAGGFYLQLGAYGRKENAEAVRAKLAMDGGLSGLEIVPSGDVHRLYAGPYATRQEAAQAIPGLPPAMGLKPLIIQR
ncbi:septal ring lytic transglycosylase RlpA family protein [Massilia sp. FT127W]|uniref:Endolytic peptidoglycan transglycosylase RlpA n=2 Tax=Pseudoduganella aquatica TaxID=2660641 RepID=A0A7X4HBU2_9BURK|nr:septal ring lytic transglycosylase RlpA family protein [Pseudoduganella aquatica]